MNSVSPTTGGSTNSGSGSTGSELDLGGLGASAPDGGTGGGAMEVEIISTLPPGFTAADNQGGWLVHQGEAPEVTVCTNILRAIARDLPASHPDFQEGFTRLVEGIVEPTLGMDRKPVFAGVDRPDDLVTSAETFADWYNNVPEANIPFIIDLWMEPVGDTFVFDSASFFPLAGMGYALESCDMCEGQDEGFHFTTELHTKFQYNGGEEFLFIGDDDVWVFINGQLAMDLGGVHGAEQGTVLLDNVAGTLGLTVGGVYDLDMFQAERFTVDSNFRIETTLDFTECGEILPVDVIR
jgi:fibro-slime domain-containing protein